MRFFCLFHRRSSVIALLLFFFVVYALLATCTRVKTVPQEEVTFPESYFPLKKGQTRIYRFRISRYNEAGILEIAQQHYIKQTTVDTFVDEDGRNAFQVRIDSSDTFPLSNPVTIGFESHSRFQNGAEVKKGNSRIVVLEAPVKKDRQWDGLRYTFERPTGFNRQLFQYVQLDTTLMIGNRQYNNCIMVQQRLIDDLTTYKVHTYEIYAPEVGLIKRYDKYQVLLLKPDGTEIDQENSYLYEVDLVESD
jgi:hypothetical protein